MILRKDFKNSILGFSDHTQSNIAAILAASKGSKYFEKHLTFQKKCMVVMQSLPSEPSEFKNYCKSLKDAEVIIENKVNKNNLKPFMQMRKVFQKSIIFNSSLKGPKNNDENDKFFMKPGKGISANKFKYILGKRLKKNVKANSYVKLSDLKN